MTVNNFIPQIWAGNVLKNLHKAQVWAQPTIVNRDYEGAISQQGDSVRIGAIGSVTVGAYNKNQQLAIPQALNAADTVLTISQADYFQFGIDDVDKRQVGVVDLQSTAMWEAGYSMSDSADQFISGLVTNAANFIGTDVAPQTDLALSAGVTTAYSYMVQAGVILSQNNVPKQGRYAVVPPWFIGLLRNDDRFVRYGTDFTADVLTNGLVARVAGFDIYESLNVKMTGASTNVFNVAFGHPLAITFAEDMTEVEAFRHPLVFMDAVRGLHLYGGRLVRPQALCVLKCQRPAGI